MWLNIMNNESYGKISVSKLAWHFHKKFLCSTSTHFHLALPYISTWYFTQHFHSAFLYDISTWNCHSTFPHNISTQPLHTAFLHIISKKYFHEAFLHSYLYRDLRGSLYKTSHHSPDTTNSPVIPEIPRCPPPHLHRIPIQLKQYDSIQYGAQSNKNGFKWM